MNDLKKLLKENEIVEFVLRKNGMVVRTFKSLKSLEMRLPANLQVTDLF